jgi:hypothetical protein
LSEASSARSSGYGDIVHPIIARQREMKPKDIVFCITDSPLWGEDPGLWPAKSPVTHNDAREKISRTFLLMFVTVPPILY